MLLSAVMDDLAAALGTIGGLNVFPYWADRVTPPWAIVEMPDAIAYDLTMGRGGDQITGSVMVGVGKADARSARDALAPYADGSGSASVKAAIEAHTATAYHSARVARAEFGVTSVGGTEYLAVTFTVDLTGQGA